MLIIKRPICALLWAITLIIFSFTYASYALGQSYNHENTVLANYLQRHYEYNPFEGLREIEVYNCKYLECVVTFNKDCISESQTSRIAFLNAARMVSEYENGVRIIEQSPMKSNDSISSSIFTTSGITGKLSLLATFGHKDKVVYIYIKKRQ